MERALLFCRFYVVVVAKSFRFREKAVRRIFVLFLVNRHIEIISVTPSFDVCWPNKLRTELCWPILLGSQCWMVHHNECFLCFSATFIQNFFRISCNQHFSSLMETPTFHMMWYMWHKAAYYYTQCVISILVDAARVCTLVFSLMNVLCYNSTVFFLIQC